jgi:UDP-N-acetylmuramoyl-tripeptide--D-alanyl-D-alanine ligase
MSQNAALAIHLARQLGVSTSQIQTAFSTWRPAKWRGELIHDRDPAPGAAAPTVPSEATSLTNCKLKTENCGGGEAAPADRLFYLDLYNANPASMLDSLDAFSRLAPPDRPRLYVLGCMEELGADSARYHRELGQYLSQLLRPQDEAIFIGDHAADIAADITTSSAQITIAATTPEIAARIATFKRGAIFLKASRRYALENALPPALATTTTKESSA